MIDRQIYEKTRLNPNVYEFSRTSYSNFIHITTHSSALKRLLRWEPDVLFFAICGQNIVTLALEIHCIIHTVVTL